jgi:hypothetical protein
MRIAVRVMMRVMLVDNHSWFVSDDDFITSSARTIGASAKREARIKITFITCTHTVVTAEYRHTTLVLVVLP